MHEFVTRVESRFRFSKKEAFHLFIIALVASFGITIKDPWHFSDLIGGSGITPYIINLIIITAIMFISFLIHFSVQKFMALKLGYVAEYKIWINGLLIGLILCVFSEGWVPLFLTGALLYDVVPKLRIGTFRGGVKHKDLGLISFAGPFSNLFIVGILALLHFIVNTPFVKSIIVINLLIAIYSLIPIPTFEKLRQFSGGTTGLYLFIASRWTFALVFVTVVSYSILVLIFHVFSYVLALVIGVATAIIYYSQFEMKKN